jgi:hypothetical protein
LDKLRGFADRFREVANEKDLEHTQRQMVEIPVTRIIEQLQLHGISGEFDVGGGIVFESHPNIASDAAEEPRERLMNRTPLHHRDRTYPGPHQLRADQICVYKYEDGGQTQRRMAFVVEYKAPHKLTLPHLRIGLREMDIYTEVVNRASKPLVEDTEALFQYTSDRLAAAAVVQTFHYMIEGGLEYSYITTGEAFIFLKIDWNHPDVLYYHLAEPGEEVQAHPDNLRHCTAVSQVLAFTLLAVASPTHGQRARHEATEMLRERKLTWKEDYESILYAIPASERKQTPPPSAFEPRNYRHVDRSPYLLRKGKGQSSSTCRPDHDGADRMQSPEPSDDESPVPDTPVQPRRRTQPRPTKQQRGNDRSGSSASGGQTRQYCTQKCLLGLVRGGILDENCPNVSIHRGDCHTNRNHLITYSAWLRLLREQLSQTLDDNIEPLWTQGARGIMFKVTLGAYGYTVLSKGTVLAFVEDLQHEAVVYQRLQRLQGVCVPVFLGSVDLDRPYYYDFQVRVIHMMFLSWGGERMSEGSFAEEVRQERSQELVRSVRAIHSMAVVHGDIREPNVLWNSETGRVMVIDFERAVLLNLDNMDITNSTDFNLGDQIRVDELASTKLFNCAL